MLIFQEIVRFCLGVTIGLLMSRKELYQIMEDVETNRNEYK